VSARIVEHDDEILRVIRRECPRDHTSYRHAPRDETHKQREAAATFQGDHQRQQCAGQPTDAYEGDLPKHPLGFEVKAHGFRSLLADLLNERGFNPDAIERQLSHVNQA
jgi:hypothetical protein